MMDRRETKHEIKRLRGWSARLRTTRTETGMSGNGEPPAVVVNVAREMDDCADELERRLAADARRSKP